MNKANRISKTNRIFLITAIVAVTAAGIVFYVKVFGDSQRSDITNNADAAPDGRVPSINGTLVAADIAERRPIAVMVENHPDARPQSGLDKADIVYETLAEGGITRFMGVYHSQDADSIGPIRSARDYYADLANEIGALYAHVGGSDEVLQKISNNYYKRLTDVNEFFNGTYFTRITSRLAPHNTYGNTETLRSYLEKNDEETKADVRLRPFTETITGNQELADSLTIDFSTPSYKVGYAYNTDTHTYTRSQGSKPHTDAVTKKPLETKNIIIQYVKTAAIPGDEKLRIDIDTKSGGKALVFRDGVVMNGTWKVVNGSTRFLDANGTEIELHPGTTWIELVPVSTPNLVTWKNTTDNTQTQ